MEKYYHNNETDAIEELDYIRSDYYEAFGQDYDTFGDYLNACMTWNNGALTPVSVRPAPVTPTGSRRRVAKAFSSVCWTLGASGWTCQPQKSAPQ